MRALNFLTGLMIWLTHKSYRRQPLIRGEKHALVFCHLFFDYGWCGIRHKKVNDSSNTSYTNLILLSYFDSISNLCISTIDCLCNCDDFVSKHHMIKVYMFWEGHKTLQNLHRRFVLVVPVKSTEEISQKYMNFNPPGNSICIQVKSLSSTNAEIPKVRLYLGIVFNCPLIGSWDTERANQRAAQNNYFIEPYFWGFCTC